MIDKYRSGVQEEIGGIKHFIPNTISNLFDANDSQMELLLSKTSWYLGNLEAVAKYLPHTQLFFSILMFNEALKSNEIEGTVSTLQGPLPEFKDHADNKKVMNYYEAFKYGREYLKDNNFSHDLLFQLHKLFFKDLEDSCVNAGKYRTDQNWIGGISIYEARFVPPPSDKILPLMDDLIAFINDDDKDIPDLIKIAIAHYQFETIHPFDDGNGRLGRMIIGLYLIKKGVIQHPLFVSYYLAKNRSEYYFNLDSVRFKNQIHEWIKFFLETIKEATKETIFIIDKVIDLKTELEEQIKAEFKGASNNALEVLKSLFENPITDAKMCTKIISKSPATVINILNKLEELGIVKEITHQKRNRVYFFDKYMRVINETKTLN